jgi:hypothetical protein
MNDLEKFVRGGQAAQKAVDETVAKVTGHHGGYWLPEDCTLKLTQLELGALLGILCEARRFSIGTAMISKPGPNGEPVLISIVGRLIEKVEMAIKERKSR